MFMSFVWTSFSHSSYIPHASYPCSYLLFFPSFLLIHLSICDKKEESILVCFVIYIWLMCTFVGRENHRGDAYTKGEKTFLLCFFFHVFFMVLWYALLLSLHHVYVLNMHTSLCYCALLVACSDDHLLCYMIIVVISIWLFCVWSSCSYVSQQVYLIAFYLLHYTCPFITCFTLRV